MLSGLIRRLGRDPKSKRRPGLLWIGSPCSPWRFYTTYCEKNNVLAEHLAIACKKARREGARWAWETTANGGTDLWRYQPVKNMLQSVSASSVTTHACAFMERTKATGKIYSIKSGAGSKATLKELQRPCVFWPDKLHPVTLMRSTSRGIEGNAAAMRESSEYTDQFASAVVDAYFPS